MRPMQPERPLAAVVGQPDAPDRGHQEALGVHQAERPAGSKNRRAINADDKLRPVFGGRSQVTMFDMTKLVNKHLS